jgi:tetratricopeptide (TPR) repeat protein
MNLSKKSALESVIQTLKKQIEGLDINLAESTRMELEKDLLFEIGQKYHELNDYGLAIENLEIAASLSEKTLSEKDEKAEIYFHLANAYSLSDQKELAINTYRQALGFDEQAMTGKVHHHLGNFYFRQEEWEEALANYQQAIDFYQKHQNTETIGVIYNLMGAVYANQQKPKKALSFFESAIDTNLETQNHAELGKTFHNLRFFLAQAMTHSNIANYYEHLLQQNTETENQAINAFVHHNYGLWHHKDGNSEKALLHLSKALELKQTLQIQYELGHTFYHLGAIYEEKSEHLKAFEYHVKGLKNMLQEGKYESVSVITYFLESSMEDMEDENLKKEAQDLIHEAEEMGLNIAEYDLEDEELELDVQEGDDKDIEDNDIEDLAENLAEVAQKDNSASLDELKTAYQNYQNDLPQSALEFAQVALQLIQKLEKDYKGAWFSKGKKKKELDEQKQDALKILNDVLNQNLEKTQKEKIKEWMSKMG